MRRKVKKPPRRMSFVVMLEKESLGIAGDNVEKTCGKLRGQHADPREGGEVVVVGVEERLARAGASKRPDACEGIWGFGA